MSRHAAMRGNAQDEGHGHHGGHLTLANDRTIDEAPGAYKPIEDIIGPTADAVDIIDVVGPIYNFKTS